MVFATFCNICLPLHVFATLWHFNLSFLGYLLHVGTSNVHVGFLRVLSAFILRLHLGFHLEFHVGLHLGFSFRVRLGFHLGFQLEDSFRVSFWLSLGFHAGVSAGYSYQDV